MKFKQQLKNNIHLVLAFVVLIIVSLFSYANKESLTPSEKPVEIDTVIPKGYVLVPLQLENMEAISSVIQNFGVIDLYVGNPESGKSKRIAHRIKLVRAPYNPNLFAALVKENLSEKIMKESGVFYAIIQNKSEVEGPNEIESTHSKKSISIEYQKE